MPTGTEGVIPASSRLACFFVIWVLNLCTKVYTIEPLAGHFLQYKGLFRFCQYIVYNDGGGWPRGKDRPAERCFQEG